jgi:hypothetical protein
MKIGRVDVLEYNRGVFLYPLPEITLTQKNVSEPLVIHGSGLVCLRDGDLFVELNCKYDVDQKCKIMNQGFSGVAGTLVPESDYYDMVAVDINGRSWSAERISVGGQFGIVSAYIKAKVRSNVKSFREQHVQVPHISYWLKGELKITPGTPENTINFPCRNGEVEIQVCEGYSTLLLTGDAANLEYGAALVKALEVIGGALIQVFAVDECDGENAILTLYSFDESMANSPVPGPINTGDLWGLDCYLGYLTKLSDFFVSDSVVYGYWFKLNRVWQAGLENVGLAVSVSIEGILKKYYSSCGDDPKFREMCRMALPELEKISADTRVLNRMRMSLEQAGGFNPKQALKKLSEEPFFDADIHKDWTDLRNAAAHAEIISDDPKARQRLLNKIFANLRLFYDLVAWNIKYHGKRRNYKALGFPDLDAINPGSAVVSASAGGRFVDVENDERSA